jgi:hypothetical protein
LHELGPSFGKNSLSTAQTWINTSDNPFTKEHARRHDMIAKKRKKKPTSIASCEKKAKHDQRNPCQHLPKHPCAERNKEALLEDGRGQRERESNKGEEEP